MKLIFAFHYFVNLSKNESMGKSVGGCRMAACGPQDRWAFIVAVVDNRLIYCKLTIVSTHRRTPN
jgi:hypothetical protein